MEKIQSRKTNEDEVDSLKYFYKQPFVWEKKLFLSDSHVFQGLN